MKKYYMAFVDFSEVVNVTADEEQLVKAKGRLTEVGLLTEKGNPSPSQISSMAASIAPAFLNKLQKRTARRAGGIAAVRDTLRKLHDRKEYTAVFLYLAFLYGFMEWQVPERIALLPAVPEAMKCFSAELLASFDQYLDGNIPESEEPNQDAGQTDM